MVNVELGVMAQDLPPHNLSGQNRESCGFVPNIPEHTSFLVQGPLQKFPSPPGPGFVIVNAFCKPVSRVKRRLMCLQGINIGIIRWIHVVLKYEATTLFFFSNYFVSL